MEQNHAYEHTLHDAADSSEMSGIGVVSQMSRLQFAFKEAFRLQQRRQKGE